MRGRYAVRSVRSPLASIAAARDRRRARSSSPVASGDPGRPASVSTTAGGVPRVCRTPGITCTAAYGGTRTSTELPGARSARTARKCLTSSLSSAAPRAARAAATAAGSATRRRAGTSGRLSRTARAARGAGTGVERGVRCRASRTARSVRRQAMVSRTATMSVHAGDPTSITPKWPPSTSTTSASAPAVRAAAT